MNEKHINIVRKWYDKLPFSERYDAEFENLLTEHQSLPQTDIYSCEFGTAPEDGGMNLLLCLYFCEALEFEYNKRGISGDILYDTLLDIVYWTDTHYDLYGDLGVSEVNWLQRHFKFEIFRLGRLQFALEKANMEIPELGIKSGDNVIGVHIPRGSALEMSECIKSFERARDFFVKYFAEFDYNCFVCASWLLDDTLLQFMSEDSNIIKFQRLFTPVKKAEGYDILKFTIKWNVTKENLSEAKPINSFTKRVKEYVLDGGKFYVVIGYVER